MADAATRLLAIEHEISAHRLAYLHAYWGARYGECVEHDEAIDRLIAEWQTVRNDAVKVN